VILALGGILAIGGDLRVQVLGGSLMISMRIRLMYKYILAYGFIKCADQWHINITSIFPSQSWFLGLKAPHKALLKSSRHGNHLAFRVFISRTIYYKAHHLYKFLHSP
jgi:hypothetical protein